MSDLELCLPPQTERKWHFIINDCRRGPVDDQTFRSLLSRGKIGPETEVWRKGMDNWTRLRNLPFYAPESSASVLRTQAHIRPDAAPGERPVPTANPWPRLLARALDTLILLPLSAWLLISLPGGKESADLFFALLMIGGAWLLESLSLAFFAATPGKLLLGLKVLGPQGRKLNLRQAGARTAAMWVMGMGLFLSWIVSLAFFWASYRSLRYYGVTIWDAGGEYQVVGRGKALNRAIIAAAMFVMILGLEFINIT
ncbi:MAG: RDD family protein [Desulfarculales bacterium]|nr:RDD family protein [Desulfarculales bacterium]